MSKGKHIAVAVFSIACAVACSSSNAPPPPPVATANPDFSECTVSRISEAGSVLFEEASNPVVSGSRAYVGYIGAAVTVVAASDNGATLGAPVNISSNDGSAWQLRLGASGDDVYALWVQNYNGNLHLKWDASHADAAAGSWDAVTDLGPAGDFLPQIAIDGSKVHIAYQKPDGAVIIRNSADSGRTFDAGVQVGTGNGEIVEAVNGSDIYVAWNIETITDTATRWDAMFAASHDGGTSFTPAVNLSASRPGSAREPIFSLNSALGRLSLVWREDQPQQGAYMQTLDGGNTWSPLLILDGPARQFMVVDDGSYIYVSYLRKKNVDDVVDWQVHVAVSTDGGHSFPKSSNLSGPTGISTFKDDEDRPIPWLQNGEFRLTGIEADGVHLWDWHDGEIRGAATAHYLGPGNTASPQAGVSAWMEPDGTIDFAFCH